MTDNTNSGNRVHTLQRQYLQLPRYIYCALLMLLPAPATADSSVMLADANLAGTVDAGLALPEESYAPRIDPLQGEAASATGGRRITADLWPQMVEDFALLADIPADRISKPLERYRKQPYLLKKLTSRSEPYMAYIVRQVRARNMPMEIALLPMIESGFDPFAYSPGRAAGLWQFIPMTAQHVGLKMNWWYDGRRDLLAGTDAALDYLQDLHRRFNDDWLLALAAYNAGAGNVHKAMRRARRNGKEPTYWNLRLPTETQRYIPKLLALATVVKNHEAYGIERPPLSTEQNFVKIAIGGQLDLSEAARMAGISVDEMYRLNPAFNRWATDPDGPHRLLVPVASRSRFIDALEQLERQPRVHWRRYIVQPGDTLLALANKFNTDTRTIQAVNRLQDSTIRAGTKLMVPIASKGSGRFSLTPTQLAAANKQRVKQPAHRRIFYTVKEGDSLWTIGKRHNVSYLQLKRWNAKKGDAVIKPGDKLVIWKYAGDENAQDSGLAGGPGVTRKVRYKVRSGDSLDAIANRFKVGVQDLANWNNIDPKKYIQPGQELTLYVNVTGA